MEEEKESGDRGAIAASIRSAKKASRPAPIGEPERRPAKKSKGKGKGKKKTAVRAGKIGFDRDMGQKRSSAEGVRARKGDVIGGMGKKKGGKGVAKGKGRRK